MEDHYIDLTMIHNILGYSLNYMIVVEEAEASENGKQADKRNSQHSNNEKELELKFNVLSSVKKINTELTSILRIAEDGRIHN